MSRRSFLRHAALTSLVVAYSGVSRVQAYPGLIPIQTDLAPGAFLRVPELRSTMLGEVLFETEQVQVPRAFTDIMLRWQVSDEDLYYVQFAARVSSDGATWTRWGDLELSDDPLRVDELRDVRWSCVLHTGVARFFQVRVLLHPTVSGSMPRYGDVQVHTVDADLAAATPGVNQTRTNAVGTEPPDYVSRTAWGCPDGEASRALPENQTVTHLVVHHTGDSGSLSSSEPNWTARVRAYWSFHAISRGWGDIGYNWLIAPDGVLYAGRAGSVNGDAVGFHDTANYGSMGVAVIGTYTNTAPPVAAQETLIQLLTWKAHQRGINPLGKGSYAGCARSTYCAPKVDETLVPCIAGHRQITPGHTTCPGDAFQNLLPSIAQRVSDHLQVPIQAARLVDATILATTIPIGGVAQVAFTVQNIGTMPIETQEPNSSWTYDAPDCFLGTDNVPAYPKETGRLRITLGFAGGSPPIRMTCNESTPYPWRWGLDTLLQPGETRTITAAVCFDTPGTYMLEANLIHEYIRYYGTDGRGTGILLEPITVKEFPFPVLLPMIEQ